MSMSKENIPLIEIFPCVAGQRFNNYKNKININIIIKHFFIEIHA